MIEKDIFWSYSRWQQFNYCERAYFYQYCCDKSYFVEKVSILKKLNYADALINNILYEAFTTFIGKNKDKAIPEKQHFKTFFKVALKLYRLKFLIEPKEHIYEVYYNEFGDDYQAFAKEYYNKLFQLSKLLVNDMFFKTLNSISYISFKWLPTPATFTYNDVNIWVRPMLMFKVDDRLCFAHIASKFSEYQLKIQLTINALLGHYNFFTQLDRMYFDVFFMDKQNSQTFFIEPKMIVELDNLIKNSVIEMEDKKLTDKNIEKQQCHKSKQCLDKLQNNGEVKCKFKELCWENELN